MTLLSLALSSIFSNIRNGWTYVFNVALFSLLDLQQHRKRLDLPLQCRPLFSPRFAATSKAIGPTPLILPSFLSSLRSTVKSYWTYAFNAAPFLSSTHGNRRALDPYLEHWPQFSSLHLQQQRQKRFGPTPLTSRSFLASISYLDSSAMPEATWTHVLDITLVPFYCPHADKEKEHNNPLSNSFLTSFHNQAWRFSPKLS